MRLAWMTIFAALAVGTASCDSGIDNKGYCQQVCAEKQAEACMVEHIHLDCEHEATCPITWNEDGLDYTDYIDCVYGRYTCDASGEFAYAEADCVRPSADDATE